MKEEANLFLDEGYLFGKAGEGFERINLAVPKHVLVNAMERMKKAFTERGLISLLMSICDSYIEGIDAFFV